MCSVVPTQLFVWLHGELDWGADQAEVLLDHFFFAILLFSQSNFPNLTTLWLHKELKLQKAGILQKGSEQPYEVGIQV